MNDFTLADLGGIAFMLVCIVVLVGIVVYVTRPRVDNGSQHAQPRSAARPAPQPARRSTPPARFTHPARQPAESPPRVLPIREWLAIVNDEPDDAPHLFIYGASGTGKTTLAQAILQDRLGQVVIFDPKNRPGKWGAAPAIGVDPGGRYTSIEAGLQGVLDELHQRQDTMASGGAEFVPLTVVLDELPLLNRNTQQATLVLKEISEIGRELGMRLVILSWSKRVKELGIDGSGDAIDQFVLITLRRATRRRLGFLAWDEDRYPIALHEVVVLARRPIAAGRFWLPAPSADESVLSVSTQAQRVPVSAGAGDLRRPAPDTSMPLEAGTRHQDAVPPDTDEDEPVEGIPARLTPEAIRTLYKHWGSKNPIAAMLYGRKQKRLAQIDQALGE